MLKFKGLWYAILSVICFYGCNSKFDQYGKYKEETFVYGVLNPEDSIQYFKIYKIFITQGRVDSTAKILDSIYYKEGDLYGYLEEFSPDNVFTGNTYILKRAIVNNKKEGIFAYPVQVLYYTLGKINYGNYYKLSLNVKRNDGSIKKVEAKIRVPKKVSFQLVGSAGTSGTLGLASDKEFLGVTVQWEAPPDIGMYELKVKFRYYDSIASSGRIPKFIEYTQKITKWDNSSQMKETIKGEDFYGNVASRVPSPGEVSGLVKRIPDSVYVILWAADKEFTKYINSVNASSSMFQTQKIYTNIQNGYGILASRYYCVIPAYLDYNSRKELVNGTLNKQTGYLLFCEPQYNLDPNYCFK